MRTAAVAIVLALAVAGAQGQQWPVPAQHDPAQRITDALLRNDGDHCVSESAKVGDVFTSAAGNVATIRSLSGRSTSCRSRERPIRARLDFDFRFTPEARIRLPEGFSARPLTDLDRFHGRIARADEAGTRSGVLVFARPRKEEGAGEHLA